MKDMEVSVMAKVDNTFVAGNTFTDENGKFQLPVTSFEGEVEAVFQIRRRGSKHKKAASVMLDRNFAPTRRAFSYEEEHPQWIDKNHGSPFKPCSLANVDPISKSAAPIIRV